MKTPAKHAASLAGISALGAVLVVATLNLLADVPQPVLRITPLGTNQFLVVITNGVTNVNYEIYRTPVLGDDLNYPFTLHIIGNLGQTNFTIDMGPDASGFILAGIGSDWDADGIENYRDANPNDPNVGVLSVTIDSPTSGQLFQ